MQRILKYEVTPGQFSHVMPIGAQILTVARQHATIQMWALVDADESRPEETRRFYAATTGETIYNDKMKYLGTAQLEAIVAHVFEVPPTEESQ